MASQSPSLITVDNLFTQSEITCMDACPRKHYYNYILQIKRRGVWNWYYKVGDAVHAYMQALYRGEKLLPSVFAPPIDDEVYQDDKFEKTYRFWEIVFPRWVEAYRKFMSPEDRLQYATIDLVEETVKKEYAGLTFTGKIDVRGTLRKSGKTFIKDHKTASSLNGYNLDQIETKFQFLYYFWLSDLDYGDFIVNILRKPALQQKKGESDNAFAERTVEDIDSRPEKYFIRHSVEFTEENVSDFQRLVIDPKIPKLKMMVEGLQSVNQWMVNERNLGSCYHFNTPCIYQTPCMQGDDLIEDYYVKKTSKHEELESEA